MNNKAPSRDLHLFADGAEIAQGCPIFLTAQESLTLRPAMHQLEIRDLSDASVSRLSKCMNLEVRSGNSVLAFGKPVEVLTRTVFGEHLTSAVFSPGMMLWHAMISLCLDGGMKVSDTIREILNAASFLSPGDASVPLAAFAAEDRIIRRPQAFFGRACDALTLLAETVDADVFLSSAGICVSGREERIPSVFLPESALLSEPVRTGDRHLLVTSMAGWPLGAWIRFEWKGIALTGRLVSRLIQADNREGPWKSELELECPMISES